jgi:N-acetyl-gamma-glutamyl-phosphate reductase
VPDIKSVRGSNYCDIKVFYDERTDHVVTISVLDNLVKGASGQAIQNMNIMLGIEEEAGLSFVPLHP